MRRKLLVGLVAVLLGGCQITQEQDIIRPLRENAPKLSRDELLLPARKQADLALEKSYLDAWGDGEDVAKALEQTARLVPGAPQAPDKKDQIKRLSDDLVRGAQQLVSTAREMAKLTTEERQKKQPDANALLLSVGRKVRALRAVE